ncbi:MAG: hypothetical protein OHK0029_31080 [Armatimonadaceae bacterium]
MPALPDQFFHTTPLHYAPYLLATGAIYSQAELRRLELPITPRPTAAHRDRKLGLDRFVHLSFAPQTPLLKDKLARGFPHVLLVFGAEIAREPDAAFVRYNAKAWRHREEFAPIREEAEKAAFLAEWQQGRYPSAELLIENALPLLPHGREVWVGSDAEQDWLTGLLQDVGISCMLPVRVAELLARDTPVPVASELMEYRNACQLSGQIVAPPSLPFD